jgi:hypothetical protein
MKTLNAFLVVPQFNTSNQIAARAAVLAEVA